MKSSFPTNNCMLNFCTKLKFANLVQDLIVSYDCLIRMKCLRILSTILTINGCLSISPSSHSSSIFQDIFGSKWKEDWWSCSEKAPQRGDIIFHNNINLFFAATASLEVAMLECVSYLLQLIKLPKKTFWTTCTT